MKRFFVLMLVLCFAAVSASFAEDLDSKLDGMTIDELKSFSVKISLKLFGKSLINGVRVDPGTYTVGKDLPAGEYRAEVILPENTFSVGFVCVYDPDKTWLETSGGVTGEGYEKLGKVIMNDGQLFQVNLYSVMLYPYTGIIY